MEYNGVISWRVTYSKQVKGKNRKSFITPDGSLEFINAIAYNNRGDTLHADSSGTGRINGKEVYSEIFCADSLARLSMGGAAVTVDPTVTIGGGDVTWKDCYIDQWSPNNNAGLWYEVLVSDRYGAGNALNGLFVIPIAGVLPVGAVVTAIKFKFTLAYNYPAVAHGILFKGLSGTDQTFVLGTKYCTPAGAGENCWAYRAYNTTPWDGGAGAIEGNATVATYINPTQIFSNTLDSISLPTSLFDNGTGNVAFGVQAVRGWGEAIDIRGTGAYWDPTVWPSLVITYIVPVAAPSAGPMWGMWGGE